MMKQTNQNQQQEIEKNIMFVSTIYESFEALEETLGKLKLEQPLFITHVAKKAFAAEVLKHADKNPKIYAAPQTSKSPNAPLLH